MNSLQPESSSPNTDLLEGTTVDVTIIVLRGKDQRSTWKLNFTEVRKLIRAERARGQSSPHGNPSTSVLHSFSRSLFQPQVPARAPVSLYLKISLLALPFPPPPQARSAGAILTLSRHRTWRSACSSVREAQVLVFGELWCSSRSGGSVLRS